MILVSLPSIELKINKSMKKIVTSLFLIFAFQMVGQAQIKVSSAAGTFDTLISGTLINYQFAWDDPKDELYPVRLKLIKPLKAFETFWDSMLVSDGSLYFSSSAKPNSLLIVEATGWDIIDRGFESDTLGLNNISQITVAPKGNEVEWMNFGFVRELDTLGSLPSNGSVKIAVDTLNNVSIIYGDFFMVRPDLCFEGLGSLHPSVTYFDSASGYRTWFIYGNPAAPTIDTFSKIAFNNLPLLGQKITLDFNKTNFIKRIVKFKISVSPNPVADVLAIGGSHDFSGASYQIISMDGRTISKGKMEANQLNVQQLKTGNYILKIQNKGEIYYSRFIKADF